MGACNKFYWTSFEFSQNDCPISLAKDILGPSFLRKSDLIDRLTPVPECEAKPNTLSRRTGLSEQPPHTDGAHETCPPAYVLLWCESPSEEQVPTHLRRFLPELLEGHFTKEFKNSIWSVRLNSRQFFYSRPILDNGVKIRWDSGCYIKCASHGLDRAMVDASLSGLPSVEFRWRHRLALLIDNRRTLHGRAAITSSAQLKRELFRVAFYDR